MEFENYDKVRQLKWDDSTLPLEDQRRPFSDYSDKNISDLFAFVKKFPEAYGRTHRLIKLFLGEKVVCPSRFVMKEAHVDLSTSNQKLRDLLISCGFEADHFATLNPPEYRECYTARLEFDRSNQEGINAGHRHLSDALVEIQAMIDSTKGVYAYTELETYSDRMACKKDYSVTSKAALETFPFRNLEFVPASDSGFKSCDLHLKMPSSTLKGEIYRNSESVETLQMQQLLLSIGFYEIRSLSGNAIYTVQLSKSNEAKHAFKVLKAWMLENSCGVTELCCEVVNSFWRKEELIKGKLFVSPIPRVMRSAFKAL